MAMLIQAPKKKWHEMIEELIKKIKDETLDDCEDRLEMAKKLGRLVVILVKSVNGWQQWMNFETMDAWTKEEFLNIYPKYKKAVIDFLKIDAEITKKKQAELDTKIEELKKEAAEEVKKAKAKKTKKKTPYIN